MSVRSVRNRLTGTLRVIRSCLGVSVGVCMGCSFSSSQGAFSVSSKGLNISVRSTFGLSFPPWRMCRVSVMAYL